MDKSQYNKTNNFKNVKEDSLSRRSGGESKSLRPNMYLLNLRRADSPVSSLERSSNLPFQNGLD